MRASMQRVRNRLSTLLHTPSAPAPITTTARKPSHPAAMPPSAPASTAAPATAPLAPGVKDMDYVLGRGYAASARLVGQHFIWRDAQGFLVHPTIVDSLKQEAREGSERRNLLIADVGTGNGTWLADLSRDPSFQPFDLELHGFDISADQFPASAWWPPRTSFHTADAHLDPPAAFCGRFDVVHVRAFITIVRGADPSTVLRHCWKLLKPGGWLQWDEIDPLTNFHIVTSVPDASTPATDFLKGEGDGSHSDSGHASQGSSTPRTTATATTATATTTATTITGPPPAGSAAGTSGASPRAALTAMFRGMAVGFGWIPKLAGTLAGEGFERVAQQAYDPRPEWYPAWTWNQLLTFEEMAELGLEPSVAGLMLEYVRAAYAESRDPTVGMAYKISPTVTVGRRPVASED